MLNLYSARLKVLIVSISTLFLSISSNLASASITDSKQWQLLNTQTQPSSSQLAKNSLLSAMDTHINAERMAVSQVKYRVKPLIDKNSVDQGSQSVFISLLKSKYFQQKINEDGKLFDLILQLLHRTPAQVEAMQYYQFKNLTLHGISRYSPKQRSIQELYSIDSKSATQQMSLQVPIAMDFNRGNITLDPSAFMPILALIDDDNIMPLPSELKENFVSFNLPKEVLQQVPSDVIYDAFIHSLQVALSEMGSENFTSVNITDDSFAKNIRAKKAIKIRWDSKQVGAFIGTMVKSMGNDITAHITENPTHYDNKRVMVKAIKSWQKVEDKFLAKDVGRVVQVLSAILPMSLDNTGYYYLNRNNQLIGYQSKLSMDNPLYNMTTDMVMQTRYDMASVKQSTLYPLWQANFATAKQSLDGVKWFKDKKARLEYYKQAKLVRDNYQSALTDDEDSVE